MVKTQSVSSRPEKLVRRTLKDIRNRNWTKAEIESARKVAAEQATGDYSGINYEDTPQLTDAQLASMVRRRDIKAPKVPVNVRLDPPVLEWLKSKGPGHITRINDILSNVMEAEKRHELNSAPGLLESADRPRKGKTQAQS